MGVYSYTVRKKNKGRAKGGFLIGKKEDWDVQLCEINKKEEAGMIMIKIGTEKEYWKIVGV